MLYIIVSADINYQLDTFFSPSQVQQKWHMKPFSIISE